MKGRGEGYTGFFDTSSPFSFRSVLNGGTRLVAVLP